MLRFILSALIALTLSLPAAAQDAGIKDTISRQIEAFQADDFDQAFGFASPSLQSMFRTPDNFRQMVTQGYPMVWRPAQIEYLDQRTEDGTVFQKVLITDQKGGVHVLDYRMLQTEDGWKINGVTLLDSSAVAV
ncbi:DUF4864 domain-containing protein [Pseudosulfitobacter sp. DSM 107133]|jgi:hypothetical protein|uniref:DUF4864 domain-containing protein n=1 Tax=Pseudosulfitobacter sp. DSM 107133 TaxID=2883100 RepID=UPI000DF1CE6B|nr:DUF4864 domain-containing protein [Pseudosulfitobacter sp. DSM 107133]UOA25803.1 hypothetical protein DSM107133_00490 [Pseudosulfitobacter sp. DSM 107133]